MRRRLTGIIFTLCLGMCAGGAAHAAGPPQKAVIGIAKIVSHPALDAVVKGIQDELAAEKIAATYDVQNANGDVRTASSIATKFQSERVTVAVGVATPAAQALVSSLRGIPVVFSAVTDPVKAGLVRSVSKGEKGVTGVSDMTPVRQQLELLLRLKKVKRLGHVYNSSEENAVVLAGMVKKGCRELGIEYVEGTVTRSAEVKQSVQAIIGRVDAIYVSTDNTVVSAMSAVTDVAAKSRVPVVSADPSSAEKYDVLIAWGFDYYKLGQATGRLVAEILGGKKPEQLPTRFMTKTSDLDLLVNLDVARKLGIPVPKDILKSANKVREHGRLVSK